MMNGRETKEKKENKSINRSHHRGITEKKVFYMLLAMVQFKYETNEAQYVLEWMYQQKRSSIRASFFDLELVVGTNTHLFTCTRSLHLTASRCVPLPCLLLFFFYPSSHNFHEFLSMTIFSFLHAPTIKRLFVQSTCICFRLFSSNHSHSNVTVIITFSIFFYYQFIFLFFIFISIEQTNKCQFCLI